MTTVAFFAACVARLASRRIHAEFWPSRIHNGLTLRERAWESPTGFVPESRCLPFASRSGRIRPSRIPSDRKKTRVERVPGLRRRHYSACEVRLGDQCVCRHLWTLNPEQVLLSPV